MIGIDLDQQLNQYNLIHITLLSNIIQQISTIIIHSYSNYINMIRMCIEILRL